MGLDVVEIVLRVEETFAVDLPDDELESVSTVGGLYKLVLSKLDGGHVCPTSRAFYRVRHGFVDALGVPRRSMRPATELAPLLPKSIRRSVWKRAEHGSELRFPDLEYPEWFQKLTLGLSAAFAVGACIAFSRWSGQVDLPSFLRGFSVFLLVPIGIAAFAFTVKTMHAAAPFLGNILPVATAGELARFVLARNYPHIREGAMRTAKANQEEIWRVLRDLIVEQLQVREDEVVPEARFGADLGAD